MPTVSVPSSSLLRAAIGLALAAIAACASTATAPVITVPDDNVSRTVRVPIGYELRIVLGNAGPGTFESPPSTSSPILNFLGDSVIGPVTPAGPQQQFRFAASSPGNALVHFRRMRGTDVIAVVEDTVQIY